ncbi:MAG TPA: RNA polymerase sigma factor [Bryobacteraceae bacterium]|nr:RNA polymerase sigma factor [Bryobacteraceae bacterium]
MEDFAKLIEQHQASVFRTLARLTGERDGLEDMAQEVFLRLYRALPHFEGRARLSTFLYRIIVNVVNDEFSRRRNARRAEPLEQAAFEVPHPAPGPDDLFERSRFQDALDRALATLPLRDRTILTLHYQEGRSYGEICRILDIPMGSVKTQLFRAREKLKLAMKEWISQCTTTR